MWYGPNLQRSYKYMMFASKMPSLRIEQSDLKCKNGCDYFGNPQWQGYCSKCHREQMQKQRRAEKASSTSATLPRAEPRKPERGLKPASHSSFSKFEEKRLRQSENLKKTNLLKFNTLFKKSNTTEEHEHPTEKRPPEFKIPSQVNEHMKGDFRVRFPKLPASVDRDARVFVHNYIMDVIKCHDVMTVDELSERVQRQYQRFMKHMDTSPHFANVDSDMKERLMDFVEKHAMTYLHELPSIVFSPSGTDDERLDRAMSERIQQLSWVCERHLECKLDRASADCRRLLYKAISELLGMDSAASPGGKLARVRRCCRHVLQLCGAAPASADDLLPALIFTVLKANPPRLTSNINYVTRFCNAQRLMTGEGGYYFTNLCCAVSFIENLNAESLNMDKKEFDCYMAMPASIGGSSWAAALSLCGASREAAEQREHIRLLLEDANRVREQAEQLASNADIFEEQITLKVKDMLTKTPLVILPRRELPRIGKLKEIHSTPLIDFDVSADQPKPQTQNHPEPQTQNHTEPQTQNHTEPQTQNHPEPQTQNSEPQTQNHPEPQTQNSEPQTQNHPEPQTHNHPEPQTHNHPEPQTQIHAEPQTQKHPEPQKPVEIPQIQREQVSPEAAEPKLNILGFEVIERESPQNLDQWELKQTNSLELLTPSPLEFTPFDSRSIDELITPEDFVTDLPPGLSNINYDIDLSDFSGDNSIAEDAKSQDPFSPDGIKKDFDPFAPQSSREQYSKLEAFDEFSLMDTRTNKPADPFEVVHRKQDPFSPESIKNEFDPFAPESPKSPRDDFGDALPSKKDSSILDAGDSPTGACLLPLPLQPQSSGKPA